MSHDISNKDPRLSVGTLSSDDALDRPCEEERLLLILSNCQYTRGHVAPELFDCFVSHGYPECNEVMEVHCDMCIVTYVCSVCVL